MMEAFRMFFFLPLLSFSFLLILHRVFLLSWSLLIVAASMFFVATVTIVVAIIVVILFGLINIFITHTLRNNGVRKDKPR